MRRWRSNEPGRSHAGRIVVSSLAVVATFLALLAGARSLSAEELAIDHEALACVVAQAFPRIEARIGPVESVARARVYFRAEGGPAWYFVEMKPAGSTFSAAIPKPRKSLKKVNYYIEALDKALRSSRTPDFAPEVAASAGACSRKQAVAAVAGVASVVVGAPAGAPVVPLGFSASGVVSAGSVAGAASGAAGSAGTTGGAAASAGGGGLGTTAIVVGAAAVVAGGVAVAASHRGSDITVDVMPFPLAQVGDGGSVQFTASAKDASGSPISPQPRFSWSSSCVCVRVDSSGLATLSSRFGPGTCAGITASDDQGHDGNSNLALQGSTGQFPCPPNR